VVEAACHARFNSFCYSDFESFRIMRMVSFAAHGGSKTHVYIFNSTGIRCSGPKPSNGRSRQRPRLRDKSLTDAPMNDHAFDALLFDLGGVVLDIDLRRTFARWAELTSSDAALLQTRFLPDQSFIRHETGHLDDKAFFDRLRTLIGVDLSDAELLDGWNAIFVGEMPGISGALAAAAAKLPLYAFSNTNRLHQLYFSKRFADVLSHFREVFTSSDIGLRKPDVNAFQFVVDAIGVPAGRILFFDDILANVEGARACGLQAVHVTSTSTVPSVIARMAGSEIAS
jgi:glucose-1-phosphatase